VRRAPNKQLFGNLLRMQHGARPQQVSGRWLLALCLLAGQVEGRRH